MRTNSLLTVLIVISWLPIASGAPDESHRLLNQARAALTRSDLASARALLDRACDSDPSPSNAPSDIALCETESGVIDEASGYADAAEAHYLRALSIWNTMAPEYDVYHATTLMNLGSIYASQGRRNEAEQLLTQALALVQDTSHSATPTDSKRDRTAAVVTSRLGGFYSGSDRPERGRSMLNEAIAMLRTPSLSNPPELAHACNALGMLDLRSGAYKAGESNLRDAVSVAIDSLGESHPDTALYQANLGLALSLEGQYDRAEVLLNRARYIVESKLPSNSSRLATILAYSTAVETAHGQFGLAEADAQQSLAILSRGPERGSPEVVAAKVMLASIYLRERKIVEAEKILPDAVALERRLDGDPRMPDRRVLADGIRRLGELRALQGRWREAQTLYSEAIAIYESALGPSYAGIAPVLLEYADVLKRSGAPRAEVKNIEARAKAIKS